MKIIRKKIVFFTGAGVSAPSGIRPFRGENGIWNEIDIDRNGSSKSFVMHPEETWDLWGGMKNQVLVSQPNFIHRYISELESDYDITIITQNVDELHQRAGSTDVIGLHGSLNKMKCSNWSCDLNSYYNDDRFEYMEKCPKCGWALRLDIVLFGEQLNNRDLARAKRKVEECDIFIAVGTTLKVSPASHLVKFAVDSKAHTILINKEETGSIKEAFMESYIGKGAEVILPKIFTRGFDLPDPYNVVEDEDMNVLTIKKIAANDSWIFFNNDIEHDEKFHIGFSQMIDNILAHKKIKTEETFLLFSKKRFDCDLVLKKLKDEREGSWYKIGKSSYGNLKEKIWIGQWLKEYVTTPPRKIFLRIG